MSRIDWRLTIPALFTRMSMRPNSCQASRDKPLRLGVHADIGRRWPPRRRPRSGSPDDHFFGCIGIVHVVDGDSRAFRRERESDAPANTSRAAGHQGHLTLQLQIHTCLLASDRVSRHGYARLTIPVVAASTVIARSRPLRNSSNETSSPAIALAATVGGLASQIWPGPLRPGKFRFCALTVTWSAVRRSAGAEIGAGAARRLKHSRADLSNDST